MSKATIEKHILVTGMAGFIGFHLSQRLVEAGYKVSGIDNLNAYYDIQLKLDRLKELGFENVQKNAESHSSKYADMHFEKIDIADRDSLEKYFATKKFEAVIHLAAQAGVRYSIDHPESYVHSNLTGFFNMLEMQRHYPSQRFLYASSSSVYGINEKTPFSETDPCDRQISFYASTKKSNEVMAHAYSSLYGIKSIGLRFFTVYGSWGRPDMAYYKFALKMQKGESIDVYNHGKLRRDFTYIDDVTGAIKALLESSDEKLGLTNNIPAQLFNIGHHQPVQLMEFIETLEESLGQKAELNLVDMQDGDVHETYADPSKLTKCTGWACKTNLKEGLAAFASWFKTYHPNMKSESNRIFGQIEN
jgi:UDP-glucuronate 4-epimerase